MRWPVVALLFSLCLPVAAQSQSTEPNLSQKQRSSTEENVPAIIVKVGQGQLELKTRGIPLPESYLNELKTQLLIEEEFSDAVMAKGVREIVISGEAVAGIQKRLEKAYKEMSRDVQRLVELELKPPTASKQEPRKPLPEEEPLVIVQDDTQTVVGSYIRVDQGEWLDRLVVIGGKADIYGSVNELVLIGGSGTLHETAVIRDSLTSMGAALQVHPSARIEGERSEMDLLREFWWSAEEDRFVWPVALWVALKILFYLLLAALGFHLAPTYQGRIQEYLSARWLASFGWGLLVAFLSVPLVVILLFTIVGLPVIPVYFLLLLVFFAYGQIHLAALIGRKLPFFTSQQIWWPLIMGLLLLEGAYLLPSIGGWLQWLLAVIGFGAAFRAFLLQWQNRVPSAR